MVQIVCVFCTFFVIFRHSLSFSEVEHVGGNNQSIRPQVNNVVHEELYTTDNLDVETFAVNLRFISNETLKGETLKHIPEADKVGTESKTIKSVKYNNSNGGKDGSHGNSGELSDVINKDSIDGKPEEDEQTYLGFREKERHDGFKRSSAKEYPYAVLIMINLLGKEEPAKCSGSLITASWVLTAAHCFNHHVTKVVVYAGGQSYEEFLEYNKTKTLQNSAQVRHSETFYQHPQYNKTDVLQFDVAVVKVSKNFNMTATVSTVSLYRSRWGSDSYKPCVLTGFGQVFYEKKDHEDYTRKTHYLEIRRGCPCLKHKLFEDNWMCSRPREDYGICLGDSGGGLVCDGRVVAVTMQMMTVKDVDTCVLTTHNITVECGIKNTLSVFQDIKPYIGWINSKINNASLSIQSNYSLVVVGVLFLLIMMDTEHIVR